MVTTILLLALAVFESVLLAFICVSMIYDYIQSIIRNDGSGTSTDLVAIVFFLLWFVFQIWKVGAVFVPIIRGTLL